MTTEESDAAVAAAKLLPISDLHERFTSAYERYEEVQFRLKVAKRKGEEDDKIRAELAEVLAEWLTPYRAVKELLVEKIEAATGLSVDAVRRYL